MAGSAAFPGAVSSSDGELAAAYKSLEDRDYDTAITHFRVALGAEPGNTGAHKDLAYTLIKTGENAEARDEFEAALKLNRHDDTAALEFAFLAYETGKPIEARRTFDHLRKQGSAAARITAEQAFQNIDRPLADAIARWHHALAASGKPDDPSMFSAHWELARAAELRDELQLAAEEYEICRHMKPQSAEALLGLARVWQQLNRLEDAKAAILVASRSSNPRTAEQGLELWGTRYPYPYEFVNAIALDPQNVPLRRELGFLYLAMSKQDDAVAQFQKILAIDPTDELSRKQLEALEGPDPKTMGLKSLKLGYARDAIRYLRQAHDLDRDDAEVLLRLGYAYNYAHDDPDAIVWFDRARHSHDGAIASEAGRAYRNLTGSSAGQMTVWTLPMYSSRWHDLFSYGQVKRSLPLSNRWLTLYVSGRFIGDIKSTVPQSPVNPVYLSDHAFIAAAGISTRTWHHVTGWAEAGESISYLPFGHDAGSAIPDYRGGVNFTKGFGHLLGASAPGAFFETTLDGVYVSRYGKDWIFSLQNRGGWTLRFGEGTTAQFLLNGGYTHDLKNQYWAETVEFGPGFRLHMPWMRPGVFFTTDLIRGVYTNNAGNPQRPNYNDLRVGFWYAFSK